MILIQADEAVRRFIAFGQGGTAEFVRALLLPEMAQASRLPEPFEKANAFLATGTTLDEARRKLGLLGWVH